MLTLPDMKIEFVEQLDQPATTFTRITTLSMSTTNFLVLVFSLSFFFFFESPSFVVASVLSPIIFFGYNVEHTQGLSQDHSAIARVVEVGKTYEGRVVKGIYISSRNSNSTASKPAIFLDGGIHAREWVSPATVAFIAHELLKNYESDTEVRKLVDAFDWIIVPVFNVDGYEYSRKTDRMWRKTR